MVLNDADSKLDGVQGFATMFTAKLLLLLGSRLLSVQCKIVQDNIR